MLTSAIICVLLLMLFVPSNVDVRSNHRNRTFSWWRSAEVVTLYYKTYWTVTTLSDIQLFSPTKRPTLWSNTQLFLRYFSVSSKVFYPVAYIMNGIQHLTTPTCLKFCLGIMLFIWPQLLKICPSCPQFGPNFYHLAKEMATTFLQPEQTLRTKHFFKIKTTFQAVSTKYCLFSKIELNLSPRLHASSRKFALFSRITTKKTWHVSTFSIFAHFITNYKYLNNPTWCRNSDLCWILWTNSLSDDVTAILLELFHSKYDVIWSKERTFWLDIRRW